MAPKMTPSLPYKLMGIFALKLIALDALLIAIIQSHWYSQNGLCSSSLIRPGTTTATLCNQVDHFSHIAFIIVLLAGGLLMASFIFLVKWCYASFASHKKVWYFSAVVCLILDALLLAISIIICSIGLEAVNKIAYSKPPEETSTPDLSGSLGWCFWIVVVVFALHFLLFLFWFLWVPRGLRLDGAEDYASYKKQRKSKVMPPARQKSQKQPAERIMDEEAAKPLLPVQDDYDDEEEEEDQGPSKKVFWAYVPEPLQPMFGQNQNYFQEAQALEEEYVPYYDPYVTPQYVQPHQFPPPPPQQVHHYY